VEPHGLAGQLGAIAKKAGAPIVAKFYAGYDVKGSLYLYASLTATDFQKLGVALLPAKYAQHVPAWLSNVKVSGFKAGEDMIISLAAMAQTVSFGSGAETLSIKQGIFISAGLELWGNKMGMQLEVGLTTGFSITVQAPTMRFIPGVFEITNVANTGGPSMSMQIGSDGFGGSFDARVKLGPLGTVKLKVVLTKTEFKLNGSVSVLNGWIKGQIIVIAGLGPSGGVGGSTGVQVAVGVDVSGLQVLNKQVKAGCDNLRNSLNGMTTQAKNQFAMKTRQWQETVKRETQKTKEQAERQYRQAIADCKRSYDNCRRHCSWGCGVRCSPEWVAQKSCIGYENVKLAAIKTGAAIKNGVVQLTGNIAVATQKAAMNTMQAIVNVVTKIVASVVNFLIPKVNTVKLTTTISSTEKSIYLAITYPKGKPFKMGLSASDFTARGLASAFAKSLFKVSSGKTVESEFARIEKEMQEIVSCDEIQEPFADLVLADLPVID